MGTPKMTAPAPEPHGRTPDNTPIPGGGRWAWDDVSGQWVARTDETAPAEKEPK